MAGHKQYLHELLKEDQEPFHLKRYLADRRCLLKNSHLPNTPSLQLKNRKPIVQTSSSTIAKPSLYYKQACFFAFQDSPDVVSKSKSAPLPPGFLSPVKTPCRAHHNASVLLHIPARTATLLLEAAMRIQKQQSSSCSRSKSKAQIKNVGFGFFSSILKKLKDRNKNKKCEIRTSRELEIPSKIGVTIVENMNAISANEVGFSCSCSNSRLSSAGWSESNEGRSLDMETSTSCSRCSEELDCVSRQYNYPCEHRFCSSPVTPFRFSLQRSPSPVRTTSPAASPTPRRRKREDNENYEENNNSEKTQVGVDEEKEQSSPVSVLDPPFDNEEEEEEEEEGGESGEEEDYDVECSSSSFAIVQRAKEQLLYKLRRFEKLAELDPVELEKRMTEQLEVDENEQQPAEEGEDNELMFTAACSLDSIVSEVFSKSDLLRSRRRKVCDDMMMKRLVSDLISEENKEITMKSSSSSSSSREIVLGSVCKKLDSWKEVESNTIDMMVELDFISQLHQWNKWQEQREETGLEIELAIFGLLVEELLTHEEDEEEFL